MTALLLFAHSLRVNCFIHFVIRNRLTNIFYKRRICLQKRGDSMKIRLKRLPDAELEVMRIIWDANGPVTSAYVQEQALQDWKATSVLTFLSRLTEKGFISCQKQRKTNLYTPLVEKETYLQQESTSFLDRLYDGSVKDLVVSLARAGAVSEKDLQELRHFLDAQKEN